MEEYIKHYHQMLSMLQQCQPFVTDPELQLAIHKTIVEGHLKAAFIESGMHLKILADEVENSYMTQRKWTLESFNTPLSRGVLTQILKSKNIDMP